MASRAARETEILAARVWRQLFDFIIRTADHRNQVLARHQLTPNDSRTLFALGPHGRTMGELARVWGCEPASATWLVDRMETLGLAERRPHPEDRRARLVVLTAKGAKTKEALGGELYRPPPELLRLKPEQLKALAAAAEALGMDERE